MPVDLAYEIMKSYITEYSNYIILNQQNLVKLENVSVKYYAPITRICFHLTCIGRIILKHQNWLSSRVEKMTKIKFIIMPKPYAHLQTMIKGPAKFQVDRYKNVGVADTRYQG